MSLFDSIIGAVSGKSDQQTDTNPLIPILASLLAQSGGLQGLMSKFSQAGLGTIFSSWVSTGPNPPISSEQVRQVLGSTQLQELAAKLGIDPAQVSHLVAEHLPTVVDRLTPEGKIDPNANTEEGLSSLIPSLLRQFTSRGTTQP